MPATWRSVILSPPGTPGMYLPILSSSDNLPSPTSCMSSAPVNVLVTDPIRWWTYTRIRAFVRVSAIPIALTHRPLGVCTATTAPGVDAARNPARAAAASRARCFGGSGAPEGAVVPAAVVVVLAAFVEALTPTTTPASVISPTTMRCALILIAHPRGRWARRSTLLRLAPRGAGSPRPGRRWRRRALSSPTASRTRLPGRRGALYSVRPASTHPDYT